MLKNKPRTKYQTVMLDLHQKIVTGKYPIDTQLPSEEKLQKLYQVSRITIRQAVDGLVADGLVERVQGKGSFVRKARQIRRLLKRSSIESFSKTARENGFTPKMEVLKLEKIKATPEIQDALKSDHDYVIHSLRLCYLDQDPTVIENNYYPFPRFADLVHYDLSRSLYQTFQEHFDVKKLTDSESILKVSLATKEEAKLLKRSISFPLYHLRNQIYDDQQQIVQYGIELIDTERYEFKI